MPVTPQFTWEQSLVDITITATIKGFKSNAIDVFISDLYIKVNVPPAYLLSLDLLKPIIIDKSSFGIQAVDEGSIVRISLWKEVEEEWETLVVDKYEYAMGIQNINNSNVYDRDNDEEQEKEVTIADNNDNQEGDKTLAIINNKTKKKNDNRVSFKDPPISNGEAPSINEGAEGDYIISAQYSIGGESSSTEEVACRVDVRKAIKERRAASIGRAETHYNMRLDTRERQKEVEKKRLQHEQWDLEKNQRLEIIEKVRKEKEEERQKLYHWREQESAKVAETAAKMIASPKDVNYLPSSQLSLAGDGTTDLPPMRNNGHTTSVSIDFTPKYLAAPSRSRGDEDYYRKSRYRPVSVQDSPMFWKDKADKAYRAQDFTAACSAYTESIKRDGCFLTCVSNRAACYIQMHEYKKAISDCDLALTMLANTPASDTTQDRYKRTMMKLHARRGAARCWDGQLIAGVADLRMAAAYRNIENANSTDGVDCTLLADLAEAQDYMKRQGIEETHDPNAELMQHASNEYYKGNYTDAVEKYRLLLGLNTYDIKSRSNLTAALLQQGLHQEALEEAIKIVGFCSEVAAALAQPGACSTSVGDDSDYEENDENGEVDVMVAKRNAAARMIGENSGHVYLLLKAYVRASAALCGLKRYRESFEYMQKAIMITPYDDDLRDDCNRILEKLKMDTLIHSATSNKG